MKNKIKETQQVALSILRMENESERDRLWSYFIRSVGKDNDQDEESVETSENLWRNDAPKFADDKSKNK